MRWQIPWLWGAKVAAGLLRTSSYFFLSTHALPPIPMTKIKKSLHLPSEDSSWLWNLAKRKITRWSLTGIFSVFNAGMQAMAIPVLLVAVLCFNLAGAHFFVTSPLPRGFAEDTNPQPPCGGFNVSGVRSNFPIGTYPISLLVRTSTPLFTRGRIY
mgnify:FL=1